VGKELVAQAIHATSARKDKSYVSVNVAAIPKDMAAASLFGHLRGAFTGALGSGTGHFGAADGGSLFLDEIGDAPPEIQAALLRALESGEIQPVGAGAPHRIDVRLMAATDADLEDAAEAGRFRLPLLMRLAGFEVQVPPLRRRRDEIARLLVHFVTDELRRLDRVGHLERRSGSESWLPPWIVARAVRHDWPGNVRELRNFARYLAVTYADEQRVARDEHIERTLGSADHGRTAPAPRRFLSDIGDEQLVLALEQNDFEPGRAARALGLSRTSLYALLNGRDLVRKAADLDADEVHRALDRAGGVLSTAARALRVSERGLRLRLNSLGVTLPAGASTKSTRGGSSS
jgi:two-component system nitrogen regulation response regulator GlnG